MNKIGFLFSLYEAKTGERITTKSVTGNKMAPVLREIAKIVKTQQTAFGENRIVLKTLKVRLGADQVITDPHKMDSLNTLLTLATEHYVSNDTSLIVETNTAKSALIENLRKVLNDPKKRDILTKMVNETSIPDHFMGQKYKPGYGPFVMPKALAKKIKDLEDALQNHTVHRQAKTGMEGKEAEVATHARHIERIKGQMQQIQVAVAKAKKKHELRAEFHKAKEAWMKSRQGQEPRWAEWKTRLTELELPSLDKGDILLVGKFKNRKAEITGFDTDENNQPIAKTTKGDQKIFKPRIAKLMPEKK